MTTGDPASTAGAIPHAYVAKGRTEGLVRMRGWGSWTAIILARGGGARRATAPAAPSPPTGSRTPGEE